MFKKLKDIKKKIKIAKISAIAFAIIFLALIVNSVYLTYKVHKLSENYNHSCHENELK